MKPFKQSNYKCEFNKTLAMNVYYIPSSIALNKMKILDFNAEIEQFIKYYFKDYPDLLNKINETNYKEIIKECNIKYKPAESIEKYIEYINKPTCYLDIGCFDGNFASGIARHFNLNKFQTHGVDINLCANPNITFTQYDGKILPFSDNSFDLISCIFILHRTPEQNLEICCSEIFRVMKPGGMVILQEHNINNDTDKKIADILNLYNSLNYKSTSPIFKKLGFNDYKDAVFLKSNMISSVIYKFIKPVSNILLSGLTRILNDTMPREVYKRRTKEVKTVLHWGQRKLLLTEIEFLTLYFKKETVKDKKKELYVIYAGSAPGTHILYLSKLFPNVHFELYDPREFSRKCHGNVMINTYVQYFTDDTAKEWISDNHPDKTILLISDIRTGEPETQTPDMVEKRVNIDHDWQKTWYYIIKPEMAMFKFRLPWDDGKTEYLDGDIYIQPYPPPTSTETRLIVGKDAGLKTYNNRQYEEQLFYFNNYTRPSNFENILSEIESDKKYGLSNNYDSSSEVYILEQYLSLRNSVNIKKSIIRMIKEINKELSSTRTLTTSQPVKEHKKKFMINLQKLGYIPDVELNHDTFNTYVIPRYDYFVSKGLIPI